MSNSAKKRAAAPSATRATVATPAQLTTSVAKRPNSEPGSKQSRVIAMLKSPAGATMSGEIVAQEHWCSSGFANTDLDLQLKKHGVHQLIVIDMIARTCIEATVRNTAELGYDVTLVKDATADYTDDMMRAAIDINLPNYASAIVTTSQIVASISTVNVMEAVQT